jgi:hypothetical protein
MGAGLMARIFAKAEWKSSALPAINTSSSVPTIKSHFGSKA